MTDGFNIAEYLDVANSFLFRYVLVGLLLGGGLYFTIRTGFVQIRHFPKLFAALRGSTSHGKQSVSSFEAFMTSLAARVGTGNIAGVAIAITLGGPGAIFWMWIVALLGMCTSMVECTLAQVFKERRPDGLFRGGPAYYMERGLGRRWLGMVFAILFVLSYGLVFCGVQANSVADAMAGAFSIPPGVVAVVLGALTLLVIAGGVRRVSRTAEAVVPAMAAIYLAITVAVLVMNFGEVPAVLGEIVTSAFGSAQAVGGAVGYGFAAAIRAGINRGLFSNEAGLGSSPNAAATADVPHPARQGYVQALGVFFDTIIICTSTALIILLSGVFTPGQPVAGVTLTQQALSAEVGSWGTGFVAIVLLFFGFTTIIALYSYAETNLIYALQTQARVKVGIGVLRAATILSVVGGALLELALVWTIADFALAVTAIINLIVILALSPIAFAVIRDYGRKLRESSSPRFDPAQFPAFVDRIAPDVWTAGASSGTPAAGTAATSGPAQPV